MELALYFGALLLILFLGMPIGIAIGLVGFVGVAGIVGLKGALATLGTLASDTMMSYDFAVLPLFILMGNLVASAGIAEDLYKAANAWLGRFRGGLAMATVVACAGFGAVCGSSLATAATMAKVSVGPMRQYRYSDSLSAASVAAGGTLGIMIPPSVPMVFYGIMTETDIGLLFVAGIVPGILGAVLYILAVVVATTLNPKAGPAGPALGLVETLRATKGVLGMLLLFALVIGGLYGRWFTPTEGAAIGAVGGLVLAFVRRRLTWALFLDVATQSARMSTVMLVILLGALMFSTYVNLSGAPVTLGNWLSGLTLAPILIILIILAIYLLLGCVMESLSMMLLTVPIFYPVVVALGYDPIWFGIVVITIIEIGLITPPVGLNIFTIKSVLPDVPLGAIMRGIVIFVMADVVRIAILVGLPSLVLFLPHLMGG